MPPRRRLGENDSLSPVPEPRWLVIRDRGSHPLEYLELWPGTDLHAAIEAERTRRIAAGWHVEAVPRNCSFCFADRGPDRVCISIECFEPGCAGLGHG
jgi:hypothetical protein